MFAIRYLAMTHRPFEGFGAFVLRRIMKSLIDPGASELEKITESPESCQATRKLKPSSRIRRSPIGNQSRRYDHRNSRIRSQ